MTTKNNYIEKLSARLNDYQHSIADKMQKGSIRSSARKKKILLMIFCASFGTVSISLIFQTIIKRSSSEDLSISRSTIPYHIGKNFQQPLAVIDTATYNRVEHFEIYLDSLKKNNASRFAAIIRTRPHLMDSLAAFERIYRSHLKKIIP